MGKFERARAVVIVACISTVGIFLLPSESKAHTVGYQFCVLQNTSFTDNNFSEDEWTGDSPRPYESGFVQIYWDSGCSLGQDEVLFEGYLNNTGCTPTIQTARHSCINMTVWSSGLADDNNTVTAFSSTGGYILSMHVGIDPPDSSATVTETFADTDTRRVYATIAHIVNKRFRGQLAGKSIYAYTTTNADICDCAGTGTRMCSSGSTATICLGGASLREKYTIAHEYGHAALYLTSSASLPNDCALNGSSHHFGSQEYMSCAMMEGWADFVATDAWNDDDDGANPDAYYFWSAAHDQCIDQFGNPENNDDCPQTPDNLDLINMETTGCADGCVVKFMEANFSSGTWGGRGVETDWTRLYWDYHTNNPGHHGVVPSHTRMQDELGSMTSVGSSNTYDRYRIAVAANSGCDQYERLVYYAAANGADHCSGACDNVPSCTDCDSTGCP